MNNHTRVYSEDRTAVLSVVKMESELWVCTRVSMLHTHTSEGRLHTHALTECVTRCANIPSLKQMPDTMEHMSCLVNGLQNYTIKKYMVCPH